MDSTMDSAASKLRFEAEVQLGMEREIPGHYADSPLCPIHPQSPSRGKGWCPQHASLRRELVQDLNI
jgi:hypothetical protein